MTAVRATKLVVLGAGRPQSGTAPSALRMVDRERKVLDWILHAFSDLRPDVFFVGGYNIDEIVDSYPNINVVVNPNWQRTGASGSLLMAPIQTGADVYICYSDIVFRPDVVRKLHALPAGSVGVAIDDGEASSRRNLVDRTRQDHEQVQVKDDQVVVSGRASEFIGVARFPSETLLELMESDRPDLRLMHLSGLVGALVADGRDVRAVNAAGLWSDLESDHDLTRFAFGTKAETLERLDGRLTSACVPVQRRFKVGQWRDDREGCTTSILQSLQSKSLAVRSSALSEDGFMASNAGRFSSVLNVRPIPHDFGAAVDTVIRSYGDDSADHHVLVQPMVPDVRSSGVLLTRTLQVGAPYRSVAWSDGSDTSSITSGIGTEHRSMFINRAAELDGLTEPSWLRNLIESSNEIEFLVDNDALDIEFAVDAAQKLHILQVRPLVLNHQRTAQTDEQVLNRLQAVQKRYDDLMPAPPGQVGDFAVWGMMPDWNPAEIIGARPGPLAFDLYDYLVCSETWAIQRAEYGYRNVRPWPLLRKFAGFAYVDVRASFNSFVPADIDEAAATKLVNFYLKKLIRRPELHDKIEFEIALTCWSFDIDKRLANLSAECDLSQADLSHIEASLAHITNAGITRVASDSQRAEAFCRILDRQKPAEKFRIDDALHLLARCRDDGVLPFAHLARSAFVAMTLLKSAVSVGIITQPRLDLFLRSISTVGHQFMKDAYKVKQGAERFGDFVAKYGHLRPGTYNILSSSYAEAAEQYLRPVVERAEAPQDFSFAWTSEEMLSMVDRLTNSGIAVDSVGLEKFFRIAIEGRERSKFIFTRALSSFLDGILKWGGQVGLSRSEIADLRLSDIMGVARGTQTEAVHTLREKINATRSASRIEALIELPSLLCDRKEFLIYENFSNDPNFITDQAAIGPTRDLGRKPFEADLAGGIVLIPNADPGFDWIFGHAIAGFVTMYGGANSHMAIRAAEFGIPAAIGIGEIKFEKLRVGKTIELNCRDRQLRIHEDA